LFYSAAPVRAPAKPLEIKPVDPRLASSGRIAFSENRSNCRITPTSESELLDARHSANSLSASSVVPFSAGEILNHHCRKTGSALIFRTNASALSFHLQSPQDSNS
jgi:hypothetical protein